MARRKLLKCQVVLLEGVAYGIVPKKQLEQVCRQAGVELNAPVPTVSDGGDDLTIGEWDGERLAGRLLERRRRVGLSQVELARRAGVRVETLNRVERGKTTPDFATVRKLVIAMKAAEADL